jgi:hypothetical protein
MWIEGETIENELLCVHNAVGIPGKLPVLIRAIPNFRGKECFNDIEIKTKNGNDGREKESKYGRIYFMLKHEDPITGLRRLRWKRSMQYGIVRIDDIRRPVQIISEDSDKKNMFFLNSHLFSSYEK